MRVGRSLRPDHGSLELVGGEVGGDGQPSHCGGDRKTKRLRVKLADRNRHAWAPAGMANCCALLTTPHAFKTHDTNLGGSSRRLPAAPPCCGTRRRCGCPATQSHCAAAGPCGGPTPASSRLWRMGKGVQQPLGQTHCKGAGSMQVPHRPPNHPAPAAALRSLAQGGDEPGGGVRLAGGDDGRIVAALLQPLGVVVKVGRGGACCRRVRGWRG